MGGATCWQRRLPQWQNGRNIREIAEKLAVRQGFEPWVGVYPLQRFSKPPLSATQPPHRDEIAKDFECPEAIAGLNPADCAQNCAQTASNGPQQYTAQRRRWKLTVGLPRSSSDEPGPVPSLPREAVLLDEWRARRPVGRARRRHPVAVSRVPAGAGVSRSRGGTGVAASRYLPVPDGSLRPGAARRLSHARRATGGGALGGAAEPLHAVDVAADH